MNGTVNPPSPDTTNPADWIRTREAAALCGVADATLFNWWRDGHPDFPAPRQLGPKTFRWHKPGLEAWLEVTRSREGASCA